MTAAVLIEAGRWKSPQLARRVVVLAAITSLHTLIIHLLASSTSGNYGNLDSSVIEAEVIPPDQRLPNPPSFPPVLFAAISPIAIPLFEMSIDATVEQPPPASQAIEVDVRDSQPVADSVTPGVIDAIQVQSPRPITGPRGVDRYPSASLKGKESGTVVMNICVSPQGKVDSVKLARSSGFPRLDAVALGIASEYQFRPAMRLGNPVAACDQYRIVFKVT